MVVNIAFVFFRDNPILVVTISLIKLFKSTDMKTLSIVLLLVCITLGARAQTETPQFFDHLGMGFELGAATLKKPMLSGFLKYRKTNNYLKFKAASVLQESYEVNVNGEEQTRPGLSELSLVLGKMIQLKNDSYFELGTGPAILVDLKKYDGSNSDSNRDKIIQRNAAGLTAELRYMFRFAGTLGLSLSVNGNLNQQKSFATAGFGLVFMDRDL
ncbi:hypothetical protein SAMN04488023_1088 [Pedobacter rhizosphaerae]|uniref:Outer membrane protein beta-barrel domain-containing protein n=2 Tax=Pedobacter rhizosphaerae TaxID=390241 RepID=A0A1H9NM71_9SPHI|nr:hypothetical protein SAMN04488023_1088 [Pedobacter rhizosphaerae]